MGLFDHARDQVRQGGSRRPVIDFVEVPTPALGRLFDKCTECAALILTADREPHVRWHDDLAREVVRPTVSPPNRPEHREHRR